AVARALPGAPVTREQAGALEVGEPAKNGAPAASGLARERRDRREARPAVAVHVGGQDERDEARPRAELGREDELAPLDYRRGAALHAVPRLCGPTTAPNVGR